MFYIALALLLICNYSLAMEKTKEDQKASGLKSPDDTQLLTPEYNDNAVEFPFRRYEVQTSTMAGGLPNEIHKVIDVLTNAERFRLLGLTELPIGILLHGPSGTGKSTLAKIIATATRREMVHVYSSSFITSFQASGAQRVRKLFEEAARLNRPVIIFIDEIDGLANTHLKGAEGEATRAVHEIHNQLGLKNHNILVILATNGLDKVPESVKDRFGNHTIKIDLPDQMRRLAILKHYTAGIQMTIPSYFLNQLAQETEGLSCRVLENLVHNAVVIAGQRDSSVGGSVIPDDFLVAAFTTQKTKLPNSSHRLLLLTYFVRGKLPLNMPKHFESRFIQELQGWDAEKIEQCLSIADGLARAKSATHIQENHLLLAAALTDKLSIPNQERKKLLFAHFCEGRNVESLDPFWTTLHVETEAFSVESIEKMVNMAQDIAASRSAQTITRDHLLTACIVLVPQSALSNAKRVLYISHLMFLRDWVPSQTFLANYSSELENTTTDELKAIIDEVQEIAQARISKSTVTSTDLINSDFYTALYLKKKDRIIQNQEHGKAILNHIFKKQTQILILQDFLNTLISLCLPMTASQLEELVTKTKNFALTFHPAGINQEDFYMALYDMRSEMHSNTFVREKIIRYLLSFQKHGITESAIALVVNWTAGFTLSNLRNIFTNAVNESQLCGVDSMRDYDLYIGFTSQSQKAICLPQAFVEALWRCYLYGSKKRPNQVSEKMVKLLSERYVMISAIENTINSFGSVIITDAMLGDAALKNGIYWPKPSSGGCVVS